VTDLIVMEGVTSICKGFRERVVRPR
jgi:hypothetical protein